MTGPKTVGSHVAPLLGAAAASAGRPAPRIVCVLPVCVTDDEGAARARAAKVFAVYDSLPSYKAMLDKEGAAGPGDVAIVGDEASVREQILGLEDVGVTDFVAGEFGAGEDAARTRALLKEILASA
jgi:alkanesulfonate monooxygenase SsuD/methylene tetrahydromethanopterin reductase-like flavin-dependent oxidoreductase (luciferase family)